MELLDNHRIRYTDAGHANANRAREVAAAEHVPPYRLAKTVIFCGDSFYAMAVLPADCSERTDGKPGSGARPPLTPRGCAERIDSLKLGVEPQSATRLREIPHPAKSADHC
jgi:hypothetical protein